MNTVVCFTEGGRKTVMILFLFLMMSDCLFAHNLGVRGSIYQIAEPDMLTGIEQTLEGMQQSGVLARENRIVLKRTIQHIVRPTPVSGVSDLPKGAIPTTRQFNPSIMLKETIKDTQGDLIAKKGTRINPLDYRYFNECLAFINGDNPSQVTWGSQLIKASEHQRKRLKIILVNGNIKKTASILKTRIYFDQYGKLCHHFKITHTPTLVYEPEVERHQKINEAKEIEETEEAKKEKRTKKTKITPDSCERRLVVQEVQID